MKYFSILGAITALALPSAAQVAPGEGIMSMIQVAGDGLATVDVNGSGTMTFLGGFPASDNLIDSCVIDPVSGDIFAVGTNSLGTEYEVKRLALSGSAITSFAMFADLSGVPKGPGFASGLSGIDFDWDGNVFVCDNHNVWRIDRGTQAITLWSSGMAGEVNDLHIDRETNTLWTASLGSDAVPPPLESEIRSFDINAGPGPGGLLIDIDAAGFPYKIGALTFDGIDTLYAGSNLGVLAVSVATGVGQLVSVSGLNANFNSLDYDRVAGRLHTAGGGIGQAVYGTIDTATFTGTVINSDLECIFFADPNDLFCNFADLSAAVDVNDYLHTTQMFPRSASVSAGFTLEVSANGMPGDFAAIAVGEINGTALASPIILGSYGACGLGGNFVYTSPVPGGVLPGFVTSLGIGTATYDFATGVFSYGGVETLTLNP